MDRPHSTRGWTSSWKMLLLAASTLSSCFLLTRAQETAGIRIRVVPEVLKEGGHVTFTPEGLDLRRLSNCKWYRGGTEVKNTILTFFLSPVTDQADGPAHTGRETGNPDCSLHITDLKPSDSGTYSFIPEGFGVTNTGATNITVSDSSGGSSSSSGSAGAIAGTVIGSLAVILVLVGALTYIFLRVCRRNGKTSIQVVSTPEIYENIPPSGQVHPENSSSAANTYETLQPTIQSVYEEIPR